MVHIIHKQILDVCKPLIEELQNNAVEYYNKIVDDFEVDTIKIPDLWSSVKQFNDDVQSFLFRVYSQDKKLNLEQKELFLQKVKEIIETFNVNKLSNALCNYITDDFVSIQNINILKGPTGFEITANLTDNKNNIWYFETKAITAGGYNVQAFHYRYIINLSSNSVSKEIVKQSVDNKLKTEKEEKKQLLKIKRENKEKEKNAKQIVSLIRQIAIEIKDFNVWKKRQLQLDINDGKRLQSELNTQQHEIDKLISFLSNFNYNRKDLLQKILSNEIIIDFTPIQDTIIKDPVLLYYYKPIQRRTKHEN